MAGMHPSNMGRLGNLKKNAKVRNWNNFYFELLDFQLGGGNFSVEVGASMSFNCLYFANKVNHICKCSNLSVT